MRKAQNHSIVYSSYQALAKAHSDRTDKARKTLSHMSDWKPQQNAITGTYMRLKAMSFKTCQD